MTSLAEKALNVCRKYPQGASQAHFEKELGISNQECADLVNGLLKGGTVEAHMRASDQAVVFKLKDPLQAAKTKGLRQEDLLVLQAIRKRDRQGIWSKDMKRETNLPAPQITKILKTLESRQLIKSVHSVNDGKKKIYLLYDLEPATELTGGLWFAGTDMDVEFISVMQQHCRTVIERSVEATTAEVLDKLEQAKIANVKLDEASIETIISSLHAAGDVERVPANPASWRIPRQPIPERISFTARPCGICPVIDQCQPGGKISPETCIYFDEYLSGW